MPRVLNLIDTGGPGGAETVLVHLVKGLSARGWIGRTLVPREDWLFSSLEKCQADVAVAGGRGSGDIRFLHRIVNEMRRFQPDLIHAHFMGSGVYGTLASSLTSGCPLVCTFHGVSDVDPKDPLLFLKARILARNRNRVVYVSHDLRRRLEPGLTVPERLGRVVYNGVSFPETADREWARRELGVRPGEVLVGSIGNLRKAKDYGTLLRAARLILNQRGNVRFVVLGEWEETLGTPLLRLQEDLGLAGAFQFLGFRERASELIPGFDLFVSSSSSEGLPLASLEAMAAGRPVVLTRCGGVPEMVEDGVTGILVEPRSPSSLADGVLKVLESPSSAAELGKRARSSVRDHFSLPAMVDRYEALYRSLISDFPVTYA